MHPDPPPSDATLHAPVGTGWLWVDDQLVVALASAPRPIVLDPVSSAIWEDLAGGRPVGEISGRLVREHGADPAGAEDFLRRLIDQLEGAGFLSADPAQWSGPVRRARASVSPCDSAPLLKGPIETVEVTLGGAVVTIVALQRLGVVPLLVDRAPRAGVSGEASELYLFGRRPTKRDASLFDHLGTHLMSVPMDRLPELVDLLCADLAAQEGFDLGLRGVAVRRPGGFVVMHERVRAAWDEAAADLDPPARSAPLPILGAHVGAGEVLVTARSPDQPHGVVTGRLLAGGVMDPVAGPASAVALAATLLADPTDLRAARRLEGQVPIEQVPGAGDPDSLAGWVRRFD